MKGLLTFLPILLIALFTACDSPQAEQNVEPTNDPGLTNARATNLDSTLLAGYWLFDSTRVVGECDISLDLRFEELYLNLDHTFSLKTDTVEIKGNYFLDDAFLRFVDLKENGNPIPDNQLQVSAIRPRELIFRMEMECGELYAHFVRAEE